MNRECNKDYKIPGTDYIIPKGMFVMMRPNPEQCFANPYNFDPDNFNESDKFNKYGFYSFGQGPRSCIGKRM